METTSGSLQYLFGCTNIYFYPNISIKQTSECFALDLFKCILYSFISIAIVGFLLPLLNRASDLSCAYVLKIYLLKRIEDILRDLLYQKGILKTSGI